MVYQEALINKTKCNNHDFCKVVVLDVVTMMMVLRKIFVSWSKFVLSLSHQFDQSVHRH